MAAEVAEKKEILKRVILSNTLYLMDKMGLKVGKVEKAAGVSTGYLSRLGREENSTKIGLELVSALSDVLGVPMDLLCHADLAAMTESENSAMMFIGKLTGGTVSGSEAWGRITPADLAGLTVRSDGTTANPLIRGKDGQMWYASRFAPDTGTKICGEICTLDIGGGHAVWLVRVRYRDRNAWDYEMYICRGESGENGEPVREAYPVCATDSAQPGMLDSALKKLYACAAESAQHIRLDSVVKNAIDSYLTRTKE